VLMAGKSWRRGDPKIATHWSVHTQRDVSRAFPQISTLPPVYRCGCIYVRVREEIVGSQTCRIVGKSQSVLMMIVRTRT
jgi:hypothetical protein